MAPNYNPILGQMALDLSVRRAPCQPSSPGYAGADGLQSIEQPRPAPPFRAALSKKPAKQSLPVFPQDEVAQTREMLELLAKATTKLTAEAIAASYQSDRQLIVKIHSILRGLVRCGLAMSTDNEFWSWKN